MSKEQLEKAKELVESYVMEFLSNHPMFLDEDIETLKWMFKQAKRVQELEYKNKRFLEAIKSALSEGLHVDHHYTVDKMSVILRRAIREVEADA